MHGNRASISRVNEGTQPPHLQKLASSFGAALMIHLSSPASLAWGGSFVERNSMSSPQEVVIPLVQRYEERQKQRFDSLPALPETFRDLKSLPKPKFYKSRLKSNNLKIILLEDHEVPMVRGFIAIKGGSRMTASSNPALATLSLSVQRAGGSQIHPGDEFNEMLENLSARIEAAPGSDASFVGFSCLNDDKDAVIKLVSELLTRPNVSEGTEYAQNMLQVRQLQAINALDHKNDNAQVIPLREIQKLIYGENSVYVAEPTKEQIANTSLRDIGHWISTYEVPENTVVGIVGDFQTTEMELLLKKHFGGWSATHDSIQNVPNPDIPDQGSIEGNIYVIDQPNLKQNTVVLAKPGIALGDPDEIELGVFGEIINSFGGRLFDTIRSRQGLAYSVSAGLESTPIDHKGLFVATAETDKPVTLLKSLFETLETAANTIPSTEEFSRAQQESLNSFIFSIASLQDQLQRAVIYETFGISENRLYSYVDKVKATSPTKVQAAAARLLDEPRKTMVTMIIGDSESLVPELSKAFPDKHILIYPLRD